MAVFRGDDIEYIIEAKNFVRVFIAENIRAGPIGEDRFSLTMDENALDRTFHQFLELRFAGGKRLFGQFAFRDVRIDHADADDFALPVPHRKLGVENRKPALFQGWYFVFADLHPAGLEYFFFLRRHGFGKFPGKKIE